MDLVPNSLELDLDLNLDLRFRFEIWVWILHFRLLRDRTKVCYFNQCIPLLRKKTKKRRVVGSEPNMSAKEIWLPLYRKHKLIKSEFLFYRNPIVFFSISNKLVSAAPLGLKCGTHIFILKDTYSLAFGLCPSLAAKENISIDL